MASSAESMSADRDLVVELAADLCRIPSPLGSEGRAGRYLAGELRNLGFDVELQEVVRDRYNVIARLTGHPDFQSLLLNGHLDTPFMPEGNWSRDPFSPWIDSGVLYGAGIQDMKGGLAALVAGATAIANAPASARGDLYLSAVMNHGVTGLGTKYFLATCAERLDAAVNAEPTNLDIQLFHGGSWGFEIEVTGRVRHQTRLEEGVNAVLGVSRIIDSLMGDVLSFEADPHHPELPRLVVGAVSGGEVHTSTAGRCTARGDIRYLPSMSSAVMRADMQAAADRVCGRMPGLTARVSTWSQQRPYEVSARDPLVRTVAEAHESVHERPPRLNSGLPMSAAITDTSDLVHHGIPSVIYGPGDWRTEADEGIAIDDLHSAATVYARVCHAVTTTQRQ